MARPERVPRTNENAAPVDCSTPPSTWPHPDIRRCQNYLQGEYWGGGHWSEVDQGVFFLYDRGVCYIDSASGTSTKQGHGMPGRCDSYSSQPVAPIPIKGHLSTARMEWDQLYQDLSANQGKVHWRQDVERPQGMDFEHGVRESMDQVLSSYNPPGMDAQARTTYDWYTGNWVNLDFRSN